MSIILVTGSSRGIGFEIAKTFAKDLKNTVIISSRKENDLLKATETIKFETKNDKIHYFQCNYTNMKDIQKVFDFISSKFGKLDVLINNVALSLHFGIMMETSESAFDKMVAGNLKSYFFVTQKFLKIMPNKTNSSIVFISSFPYFILIYFVFFLRKL